eukprot:6451148-Amphidinium_carterae.1
MIPVSTVDVVEKGYSPKNNHYFSKASARNTLIRLSPRESRGVFRKMGKSTLPAPPIQPDGATSVEPVSPDSTGAMSRLPDSSAVVSRLPDCTVLAIGKRPRVASPTGGTPLELVSSASTVNPVGLFLCFLVLSAADSAVLSAHVGKVVFANSFHLKSTLGTG